MLRALRGLLAWLPWWLREAFVGCRHTRTSVEGRVTAVHGKRYKHLWCLECGARWAERADS